MILGDKIMVIKGLIALVMYTISLLILLFDNEDIKIKFTEEKG
ncbi:MAG: hypothetical protein QXD03_04535 [Candidatus Anstonellales archaeon]